MLAINQQSPILRELTEIRDSLSLINQELTVIGHTTEGISGATFRLSQTLIFNIGSLDTIIESLNKPEKKAKSIRDDFALLKLMTMAEKTEYDQISGLRHQFIAQWRIIENRKWELLKTIQNRLKLSDTGQ